MDGETWRWLIGGGLAGLTTGMVALLRMAWQMSGTLARIELTLATHGGLHDLHTRTDDGHETRLRAVETAWARHSGVMERMR